MADTKNIYTSGTSDSLLVRDPNETLKSRTINNNPIKNTVNTTIDKASVVVPTTRKTAGSILKKIQIKDVLLSSRREKALDLLKTGAKKDLLDGLKRLLPGDYAQILDNIDLLLSGRKQVFGTQSGDRYYGLEEIGELKRLFELRRQWDDYKRAKAREDGFPSDRSTEAVMAQAIVQRYIRLSNPVEAIDFLNTITDIPLRVKITKALLIDTVYYSQLTLTKYIIGTLSATYVATKYPDIINDIFTYYVNKFQYEEGVTNLAFLLTLCDSINPMFLQNTYNPDHLNIDLMANASKDAFYMISKAYIPDGIIQYGDKSVSCSVLLQMAELSPKYKYVDVYEELEKMYPNRV